MPRSRGGLCIGVQAGERTAATTPPAQPWITLPCKRLLRFNRGTPLNDTEEVKVILWQMCESETWAQQLG